MQNPIVSTPQDPLTQLVQNGQRSLSYADGDLAIRRPLAEIVQATLDAAAKNSPHTRRAYTVAMAFFLAYLYQERGHLVPAAVPFEVTKWVGDVAHQVTDDTGRKHAEYDFGQTPAAVLRLVDQSLVDGFAAWRLSQGDAPNTATTRLYAVRTFLSVALRENVLTPDQQKNLALEPYKTKQKRDAKPVGRRLSKPEVQALRSAPDPTTAKGKRDLAILDCGLYLGLRQAEIAGLKMSDFTLDGGQWYVTLTGKGSKTRKLRLAKAVEESLLTWCNAAGLNWHDDRPVFYAVDRWDHIKDTPITATDVSRTVGALGARAGIATAQGRGRLASHDLRRTFARTAHDNGASLLLVQRALGHSSPQTTALYIGLHGDDKSATDFVYY